MQVKAGDHLVTTRMGYSHHGLYVGNGQVIHYAGFAAGFSKGAISLTSAEEFTQGHACYIKPHDSALYDAPSRVERAYSKLGEDEYNLFCNNCEHFVSWCFDGKKSSEQVQRATQSTASAASAALLARQCVQQQAGKTAAEMVLRNVALNTTANSLFANGTGVTSGIAAGLTASGSGSILTTSALAASAAGVSTLLTPVGIGLAVGIGVMALCRWLSDD
nr:lecithin retinol acyltransferase family protein [Plesiomonas shigelloides]